MNDPDVRDERLGDLLDQAVRDLGPDADAPSVGELRGGGRRAVATVAALATAAVFVGVALWAAATVGREHPAPTAEARTLSSSDAPWTFDNEAGWHVATVASADPDAMANVLETYIANVPLPEPAGVGPGPNSGGSDALTEALGDGAAVVLVNRVWTATPATDICSQADETGPGPFADDAQNPGWIYRERRRCDGTLGFLVIEWLGPAAGAAERATAATIADSVRRADVDRWTESDGRLTTLHDESDLFTVTYPASWLVADQPINTWVSDPHEILSLGTYPLRPGGHAVTDGQVPSNAIDDMGADDVFIWVNESRGGGKGFPPRPERLSPEAICENTRCSAGQALGIDGIRAWWTYFGSEGRGIYVFVGMGEDAYRSAALDEAWGVGDSLRFALTQVPASGFFSECPSLSDAAPISSSSQPGAQAAADEFVRASNEGDADGVARLLDPAADANGVTSLESSAAEPVIGSAAAVGDPLVEGSCGQEVAARSWRVTIDDGTSSASLDTSLYLIERSDGWKVWGAY